MEIPRGHLGAPRYVHGVDSADADLIARLRGALADSAPLRLVVLFGSRATGGATPASDVDVGVLPRDALLSLGDELALADRLSGATGTEVDLVRLDDAGPTLEREIARDGLCVYEAEPGVFAAWRASAMSRWIGFDEIIAPHRQRFLRRLALRAQTAAVGRR